MLKTKRKILTNSAASQVMELCAEDKNKAVQHAQKLNLISNPCKPCKKNTPTVSTVVSDKCLYCGEEKNI
jgi:hypothetical protein